MEICGWRVTAGQDSRAAHFDYRAWVEAWGGVGGAVVQDLTLHFPLRANLFARTRNETAAPLFKTLCRAFFNSPRARWLMKLMGAVSAERADSE